MCLDFMRFVVEKADLYTQAVSNIFERFPIIEYVFKFRFKGSKNKTLISSVIWATLPCQEPHVARWLCIKADLKHEA